MAAITDAQRDELLELGFIRLDNIITEAELAWLRERYDDLFDSTSGEHGPRPKRLGGTDAAGRDALPQVLGISKSQPEFAELTYRKLIEGIAQYVHGDTARFRNDHAILKPAGYGVATPWHQDQAYHDPRYRYRTLNFWLPLEDATVENGCLWFVPYTHGGAVVPHEHLDPEDPETAMVAENQDYWRLNGVPVPCPAGSVTVHHSYCMHYAGPNASDHPRRAYITVFEAGAEPLRRPLRFPWQERFRQASK
jgi:ectoine hydroxylase-related dioxygenase (phytanoyl-CoA dioxygenase family)